ncbi:MAG: helix-turn-helix transcriptional regulator [Verrucomicrobia bacterium]|nr:helix-turn-helix transcriptional regulator [Verrucomicrobiota bacterium]MBS0636277.1 helix-turn-helix transcriptional regulator [Verrucomicrobiota bacterium]
MLKDFLQEAATSFCFTDGAKEINRICKPFLDKHDIANFYYIRLTKKGELVFLTNNVPYAMDYWGEELPTRTGWNEVGQEVQKYTILWEDWKLDKEIADFTKASRCFDGFTFANRYYDVIQAVTIFRKYPVENPANYYLQHKDDLQSWIKNFEFMQRNLIGHAIDNPMHLPQEYFASEEKTFYPERSIECRYKNIQSTLTFRELDCLALHAKGFSWPQIGTMLDLSVRTVETHLNSIKNRFGLSSRDDLAHLALSNPVVQAYSPRLS